MDNSIYKIVSYDPSLNQIDNDFDELIKEFKFIDTIDDNIYSTIQLIKSFKKSFYTSKFCTICNSLPYLSCPCNKNINGVIDPPPCLIHPKIWLGSYEFVKNSNFISSNNIKSIINCAEPQLNSLNPQLNVLCLNAKDTEDYQIVSKHGDESLLFILKELSKGHNIYIHCLMGYNRSATIASFILYKLLCKSKTMKEIIFEIIEKRPCVFSNYKFCEQLLLYEYYNSN